MDGLKKLKQIEHELAVYFMAIDCGSKINSIDKFMNKYKYGRGTIQNGIKILEDSGAITLKKDGRRGTILVNKDINLIYKHLNINFINGQLPMPYTKRYEGLAAALVTYFNTNYPFKFFTSFVRSSFDRIESVNEASTDFAVVSYKFALAAIEDNENLEIGLVLPINTYTSNHIVVKNNEVIKTVGIDLKSYDHQELVLNAFNKDKYEFINIPYHLLEDKLLSNEIDATILNKDHDFDSSLLTGREINAKRESQAAFVIRKDNELLKQILPNEKDVELIINMQNDVVCGDILPTY